MKPHKAARRRKRPVTTPPSPPKETLADKIVMRFAAVGIVISLLMMGYGYGYKYAATHRAVWNYLLQHNIHLPNADAWLWRQFGRSHLPVAEAVAQSPTQSPERIYYIHSDHLGSPLLLTDPNAQVVWRANAEPFGKTTPTANQIVYNPRFPGQYYDKETGLTHNNRRDYNSSTGRYKQPDPVADVRNSVYGYAQNNPTRYIDAEGLQTTVLRSTDTQHGLPIPHIAYRVYDVVNGQRVNDMVYTNDSKNNFHPVPYEAYKATHTISSETPLNTTSAEDQDFRDFWVRNQNVNYSIPFNRDCASVTGRAIKEVLGSPVPVQRYPKTLQSVLEDTLFAPQRPDDIENTACLPSPIPGFTSRPLCPQPR